MNAEQIVFPFRAKKRSQVRASYDLIGRSYFEDEYVTVTVTGICEHDKNRVMVRRRPGGAFSMPGWLVRSIVTEEEKKKERAA